MKAAFLTALRTVEIREVPAPELRRDDDVLIRAATVGVCGSDMHYYRTGRIGDQVVEYPWIVGHECAGTVEAVGAGAGKLKVGDRVAVDPLIACGRCDQCLAGRHHTCREQAFLGCPGQIAGSLAEYIVMPASCCYPIGPAMTMTQATLIEPFAIGFYAARRLAGDVAGKTAAVLGSGPIGLCVMLALKQGGAASVYMTDIRNNRLAVAAAMGADRTGNPDAGDVVDDIRQAEPLGVDLAFECAGEQDTLDQCVDVLKPGGTLLVVGIPELDRISFVMDQMRRKELCVRNVRRQNDCMAAAIELVAAGLVDLDPMVTHNYTLDQTNEAFDVVADYRDNAVKAMIHMGG